MLLRLCAPLAALACMLAPPTAHAGRPDSTPQVSAVPDRGYQPRVDPLLELSETDRRYLLWYARQACGGGRGLARMVPPQGIGDAKAPIIVTLFHANGNRRVRRRVDGDGSLTAKLDGVMPQVCAGLDENGLADHQIHLMVVTRTVRLPNYGFKGLFRNKVFEPQVMGVAFELNGKRTERDPIEQAMYNHGPKSVRKALMDDLGLSATAMGQQNDLIIEFYEVAHFAERPGDHGFTDYFRGLARLTPDQLDHDLLMARLRLIGEWYRNNMRPDGQVTYEFSPSNRVEYDAKRTMVRSTMAVWVLNRLAEFLADDSLKELGWTGIETYLERYFQITKSREAGRIVPSPVPLKNGNLVENRYTVASFIAGAIMERSDWKAHAADVELLMTYAMSKQRPDGIMWTQFAQSQYFMPGQLWLIVSYAASKTGDARYLAFFDTLLAAYGPALDGQMALAPPMWVPYAPAWYTQPLAHRYLEAPDDRLRDLVFAINDRVVRHHRHNADNQRHYDYDGAMTPKRGYYGNNSVTAASLESLADAAIVAKKAGDEERFARYQTAIRHITTYLLRLQFTPENAYWVRDKQRVIGGFKTDLVNQRVWMDNVWHLTSAFIKIHQHRLLDPPSAAAAQE